MNFHGLMTRTRNEAKISIDILNFRNECFAGNFRKDAAKISWLFKYKRHFKLMFYIEVNEKNHFESS